MIGRILLILALLAGSSCVRYQPAKLKPEAAKMVEKGVVLLRRGELEQADAAFEVAAILHPHAITSDALGCICLVKSDLPCAERHFKEALKRDSSYVHGWNHLALLYELRGDRDLALVTYQRVLQMEPLDYAARNALAANQAELGQFADAKSEFRKAIAVAELPLIVDNLRTMEAEWREHNRK